MPIRDDLQVMLMGSADSVVQAPQVKTDFVEDMSAEQRAVTGAVLPAGLQNLGNTCYMNATMQVFRKMTEVRSTLERVSALSPSKYAVMLSSSYACGK
jgi:ubiquitin carboxyl-terminal hydrolase 14